MIKGAANQSIGAQMIDRSTGDAFTGTVTVYITIDAGTQGIGTVGGGACVHEGNGYHTYRPSQDETNGDLIAFTFVGSNALPQTIQVTTVTAAQNAALQAATGTFAVEVNEIVTDALTEIGKHGLGQTPDSAVAAFVLGKLNRLLDLWNARRLAVYADEFDTLTLTSALQPHTIGPNSATFTEAIRPVSIDAAQIVVDDIASVVTIRDAGWWGRQTQKTLTSSRPTDLYYDPAWPNGNLYLWPVLDGDATLEIRKRVLLGAVLLTDTFWLPPGYREAITQTLAEHIAAPLGATLTQETRDQAHTARHLVFGNNVQAPPELSTAHVPGGSRGWYDVDTDRFR